MATPSNTNQRRGRRMLQVHPSLLCNYQCLHCYSSSSPQEKKHLDSSFLIETINNAHTLGYEHLSISGGEPLLYPDLKKVLSVGKKLGMSTSLISNGSIPVEKYKSMTGLVDTMGISLDGNPDLHNKIRGSKNSFQKIDLLLKCLTETFPSVNIAFTLSDQSWEYLPDIVDYGIKRDLQAVQIYPLELDGRAKQSPYTLSNETLMRAFLLYQTYASNDQIKVHFNCFSKSSLANQFQFQNSTERKQQMADWIDLIVLNEQGELLPYTYGINQYWKIANKDKAMCHAIWEKYKGTLLDQLQVLCDQTYQECLHRGSYFMKYYEVLKEKSYQYEKFETPLSN